MSKQYVIYVRKSTESEDRQELSLQAQRDELEKVVRERSLNVVRVFEEAQSAKTPGRPIFAEMRSLILAGGIDGVICWKVNRLARNPIDAGQVTWDIGKGLFREIVTPGRTYTGSAEDKWALFTEFASATKFSDDLSDDVRRGVRTTLKNGFWPGCPKLGYMRASSEGVMFRRRLAQRLIPEATRHETVREVWRRVCNEEAPLDVLRWLNNESGFTMPYHRTRGGSMMTKSSLYRLLRDSFYMGIMVHGGERYLGNHEPMVSPEEFARVQKFLDARAKGHVERPKSRVFAYRGLIHCNKCKALVTAKVLNKPKKSYTYYHCCRKERRYSYCPEPAVQETELDRQLASFIDRVRMPAAWLDALLEVLTRIVDEEGRVQRDAETDVDREIANLASKRDRARAFLLEGVISAAEYQRDDRIISAQILELQQRRQSLTAESARTDVLPWRDAIASLKTAPFSLDGLDVLEKRQVVRTLTCYLALEGKILHIQAKEPIEVIGSADASRGMSGWLHEVETTFRKIDCIPHETSAQASTSEVQ